MTEPEYDYDELGRRAILELLAQELAAPSMELMARIADNPWSTLPVRIEPIHVNNALRDLRRAGQVHDEISRTRGGRDVSLVLAAGTRRNATALAAAAARKRLLTTRYLGWAQGTKTREAVIGPAAERVTHASLVKAAPISGYRIENPRGGGASTFLGMPVPVGALDNAALLPTVTDGIPGPTVAIPIEVKNIRDWIYPSSRELYQLLVKAAKLQQSRPDVPLVPFLVARRIHVTTFRLIKDVGAFAVQTKRQYIGAVEGGEERIQEVRLGLGLFDLVQVDGADDLIIRRLTDILPPLAVDVAAEWAVTAADRTLVDLFDQIRNESRVVPRSALVQEMRERLDDAGRYRGGW